MAETVDLLRFFVPRGTVYSVPVGVTQQPGGDAIYQVRHDPILRTFDQLKGVMGVPCDRQQHAYDDDHIYLLYDNSPADGIPYALRDDPKARGSKWVKRKQRVGEVTERAPYVLKVDPRDGKVLSVSDRPVRTWLKFAGHHYKWQSPLGPVIDEVIVLEWYLDAALTELEETYVLGYDEDFGGLGFIGFTHASLKTQPNFVWWDAPPAAKIPVLEPRDTALDSVVIVTPSVPVITPVPPAPQPVMGERMIRLDITAGAKVRQGPSTTTPTITHLPALTRFTVARLVPGQDGDTYKWYERVQGGFVREDLVTLPLEAQSEQIPAFPAPIRDRYSITSRYLQNGHAGVDLGAAKGVKVYAGGTGQVAWLYRCAKCKTLGETWDAAGLNEVQRAAAFDDPDWGFGYGDSAVVRYAYGDLPDAARDELDRLGLRGAFVYVIFAHLDEIKVNEGQCVGRNTVLGTVGQDANSTGPHTHVEARASLKGDETSIYNRTQINPLLVFAL